MVRRPLYDPPVLLLVGLAAVFVLAWPNDALAWGPVTHLVHGSQVLDSLSILTPALQEILREHRLPYLYGCVAADIVQAKKYTRSLYTHCHCWPVGWQIAEAAEGERQQAFAYGYLSHLAGDVYSHNHFVPIQLVVSYQARTLRHVYWEARFDAAQARDRFRLLRSVFEHRYPDCDRLVERVVERTLFSFRTNKRIFNSVMALQRLDQWQAMIRHLSQRSRYPLPATEIDRFNELCIGAIRDLLGRGKRSACQHADPTGRDALARAGVLRRKLRALKRRGQMTEAIAAELRALAPAAA
jgi:Zinc dependent phospholipase C